MKGIGVVAERGEVMLCGVGVGRRRVIDVE